MANTKISDLNALTFAETDDELVLVDTSEGETKKITFAEMTDSFAGSLSWQVGSASVLLNTAHRGLTNEHLDWTASVGTVHSNNYTNTTYSAGDFNHDSLANIPANDHIDWTSDQGETNINAGNYTDTGDTTAHASFSQLDYASAGHTGFQPTLSANQILDWTADQGAMNIHAGNYTDTTYSASDFAHNSLSDLNDGDSYEHITQTQKDALHSQNTDTALGSGAVAADHGTAATDQVVNICYGTGDPPTANTTTIGTLFVKYTA